MPTTTPEEKAFGAALMGDTANLLKQLAVLDKGLADAILDPSLDAEQIRAAVEKQLRRLVQDKRTVQKRLEQLTY